MYDNLLLSLLLYTVLIITISLLNRVNTYVASITIVIVFILTLVASLIATIFAIFFYTKQYDYRFILEGNQYSAMILKVIITGICVYIFKVFNSLFNRKTKIQKINPRPVIFVNVIYVILIILMSTELIEYIPTIYSDVLGIEALSRLLFTGILMAYVASIFVLYILNIYLFKSSDYLTIKLSSETDALTGVLNRKAGINFLKERMQNIQLKKGFLTVCFIDVNNLKIVNDEYGHKIGDDLIKNTSNIIKQALREGDEIARLGGDEFLVVFNQCSIEQAVRAWDRIIEKLETFNLRSNAIYDISVSVGFSEYSHKMDIDHETLIELADSEMYKNKERYKRLKGKSKNGKW
jgi:diguanylate cyclase (GGDEF)-like protein